MEIARRSNGTFSPGQSGNPSGGQVSWRGRRAAAELWREMLDCVESDGRTRLEQVFDVLLTKAAAGVPWAVQAVVTHALPKGVEIDDYVESDLEELLSKLGRRPQSQVLVPTREEQKELEDALAREGQG